MKARAKLQFPLTMVAASRVYLLRDSPWKLYTRPDVQEFVEDLRGRGVNPELGENDGLLTVEFDVDYPPMVAEVRPGDVST